MKFKEFEEQLLKLKRADSISGRTFYHSIKIIPNTIEFTRNSTNKTERIKLKELFNIYTNENNINTTIVRKHITGWKYSPACAILISAGFYIYNKQNREYFRLE